MKTQIAELAQLVVDSALLLAAVSEYAPDPLGPCLRPSPKACRLTLPWRCGYAQAHNEQKRVRRRPSPSANLLRHVTGLLKAKLHPTQASTNSTGLLGTAGLPEIHKPNRGRQANLIPAHNVLP